MKTVINIALVLIVTYLSSCDNRDLYVESLNQSPVISFDGNQVFSDTIKLTLKNIRKSSEFKLSYFDPNNNLKEISFKLYPGKGKLFQNGKEIKDKINLNEANEFRYEPSEFGLHRLEFSAIDDFGERKSVAANITVFENLPPEAKIKLNAIKVLSPFEYELDASQSIDKDGKWGGGIVSYTFYVNGNKIYTTNKSKIKYIFPEAGNYNVQVKVQDIDGAEGENSLSGVTIN